VLPIFPNTAIYQMVTAQQPGAKMHLSVSALQLSLVFHQPQMLAWNRSLADRVTSRRVRVGFGVTTEPPGIRRPPDCFQATQAPRSWPGEATGLRAWQPAPFHANPPADLLVEFEAHLAIPLLASTQPSHNLTSPGRQDILILRTNAAGDEIIALPTSANSDDNIRSPSRCTVLKSAGWPEHQVAK
jgi:hypothetical protein